MASSPKKVVVFCPRGKQGESVVRYLAADPTYEIHCVTRSPITSLEGTQQSLADFAKNAFGGRADHAGLLALKEIGPSVRLVQADVGDAESVGRVLKGAYAVWWNVSWWTVLGPLQGDFEAACVQVFQQGKTIIDACLANNVQIFSFGLHTQTFSTSRHPEIDGYFRCCRWIWDYAEATRAPHCMIWSASWFDNYLPSTTGQLVPDKEVPGTWLLLPKLPDVTTNIFFPVEQNGAFVKAAFDNPAQWAGRGMYVASQTFTYGHTLPAEFERVAGIKIKRWQISDEEWESEESKKSIAPMWPLMDCMYREGAPAFDFDKYRCPRDPREIVPDLWTLKEWAKHSPAFQEYVGMSSQ